MAGQLSSTGTGAPGGVHGGLRVVVAHGMLLLMKIAGMEQIKGDPRQHHSDPWTDWGGGARG